MSRRVEEDHKDFMDVYSGRIRKELKKFISTGSIFRTRGDGQKIRINIPKIDIPHIVFGDSDDGIGRGPGKPGDVFKKDPAKGEGQDAGQEHADGIDIAIDMDEVFKFLQDELKLPNLKPKPNQTFDEIEIKYNDISRQGPESLRHMRRTMLQALKRMSASGETEKLHLIPGFDTPVKLITPINTDRRYRQYNEIKTPSSNAVIFFARDGSGSMDEYKCDIVSDMSWWTDLWIRKFYKRVERCYVWHDTVAEEVDENKFYKYRYGGGTACSSSLKWIAKQLKDRFPPEKWNIYIFYYTDGENYNGDNAVFNQMIEKELGPNVVNFIGITQILAYSYHDSLKHAVDKFPHESHLRTTSIGAEETPDLSAKMSHGFYGPNRLSEEARNEQIKRAIIDLLGDGSKAVQEVQKSPLA